MSWFGWLTKSKFEVTALDEIVLAAEVTFLFVIVAYFFHMHDKYKRWKRRK